MLLHRSLGLGEFYSLINGEKILGKYNLKKEAQNSYSKDGLFVCFFEDDYWWIGGSEHSICVIVDIPESRLKKGTGTYWASKNMAKTHIWSGRRGDELYELKERYAPYYSLKDVKSISLPDFAEHALTHYREILSQANITIMERPDLVIKNKKLHETLSIRFKTYVGCPKTSLHESFKTYLKRICNEKGYTGTIEISCYDSSKFCYEPDRNLQTRIQLDLFDRNNKNCFVELILIYSLDSKKFITNKCQNNEDYDLSLINCIVNSFGKTYFKDDMSNLEDKFQDFFTR